MTGFATRVALRHRQLAGLGAGTRATSGCQAWLAWLVSLVSCAPRQAARVAHHVLSGVAPLALGASRLLARLAHVAGVSAHTPPYSCCLLTSKLIAQHVIAQGLPWLALPRCLGASHSHNVICAVGGLADKAVARRGGGGGGGGATLNAGTWRVARPYKNQQASMRVTLKRSCVSSFPR